MFEGLRDEVDKVRWKKSVKQWTKIAADALTVDRKRIRFAFAPDRVGDLLVVYFEPETPEYEIWCIRVDAARGYPIGDPIRFVSPTARRPDGFAGIVTRSAPGAYFEHVQKQGWADVWGSDWTNDYRGQSSNEYREALDGFEREQGPP